MRSQQRLVRLFPWRRDSSLLTVQHELQGASLPPRLDSAQHQSPDRHHALISSTRRGSLACRAAEEVAPATVPGGPGVEEGNRWGVVRSPEEARGPAACAEAEVAGSCCSQAAGRTAPGWVAGSWWEEEAGPAGALRGVGRRVGGTAGSGGRNWAAWARRRDPPSSSWTAGSGSPRRTCRS